MLLLCSAVFSGHGGTMPIEDAGFNEVPGAVLLEKLTVCGTVHELNGLQDSLRLAMGAPACMAASFVMR